MAWLRTSNNGRRATLVALEVVVIAFTVATAGRLHGEPDAQSSLITLWSAEAAARDVEGSTLRVASRPHRSASDGPALYRLPAPSPPVVGPGGSLAISDKFASLGGVTSGSYWVPPPRSLESDKPLESSHVAGKTVPGKTAERGMEVVDDLPSVTPPLPPSVGGIVEPSGGLAIDRETTVEASPVVAPTIEDSTTGAAAPIEPASDWFIAPEPRPAALTPNATVYRGPLFDSPLFDKTVTTSQRSAPVEAGPSLPNTPTVAEVSAQVKPSVQTAYQLARRGALFAAHSQFVDVLRRIARAKDAEADTDVHSRALAEGMRALDEADDFIPAGVQLEDDLDVRALARSHRTPVLHDAQPGSLAHEAVATYHHWAQQKLGEAVAGEQAGSMVLYGLGKAYSQMAMRGPHDLQAERKAMTMYQAALVAHAGNPLAANEMGVLLAQGGHHAEAEKVFTRLVCMAPSATAFHNLAVVQGKLGRTYQAQLSEEQSQRLAHWERSSGLVSRRKGVTWVSPAELAHMVPAPQPPAPRMAMPPVPQYRGRLPLRVSGPATSSQPLVR